MATIRLVENSDFDEIFRMGQAFMEESGLIHTIGWEGGAVRQLVAQFVEVEEMIGLVVEIEGRLVGMLGLVITPHLFNHDYKVAEELVWWIEPEHRGGIGAQLLNVAEEVCRLKGANDLNMKFLEVDDMNPRIMERMYKRKGYRRIETIMGKEL